VTRKEPFKNIPVGIAGSWFRSHPRKEKRQGDAGAGASSESGGRSAHLIDTLQGRFADARPRLAVHALDNLEDRTHSRPII
jgi:hypothetical protein